MTYRNPYNLVRRRRFGLAYLLAMLLAGGVLAAIPAANAAPAATQGILADTLTPTVAADPDRVGVELGVKFSPQQSGQVTALQYYQSAQSAGVTRATLWSASGDVLAKVNFRASGSTGWRTVPLKTPVSLAAGKTYVASYFAPKGGYPSIEGDFAAQRTQNGFALPANAGVYTYGSKSSFPTSSWNSTNYLVDVVYAPVAGAQPAPTTTPAQPAPTTTAAPTTTTQPAPTTTKPAPTTTTAQPAPTTTKAAPTTTTAPSGSTGAKVVLGRSFPSAATTGVPDGTALTTYTGPCTIQTNNVVIDKKIINCDMRILAQGITITNSVINGTIYSDPDYFNGSFTLTDSEVRMPQAAATGIGDVNFVATRVEVTGGSRSINCAANCTVQDSYLHGQYTDQRGIDHESAVRMGAGSVIKHNTITCDATPVPPDAGCSAALTGYGDFAIVQNNTIENNLIDGGPYGSMGYCAYGGSTPGKPYSQGVNNIKFTNNIFMRGPGGQCGIWGPITSFDSNAPGNVWSNNLWDDGKAVPPAN
ncbi:DUF4082 domain-containing protein [Cumulibacter manganitolerans]|uniref:DUF4082 domain-containing protein n=1 Tax=Cumulibacter manganitolerans TaxID=1884992 RepID=UPI001297D74D|nr:DUF4082 domain-containing protein [Cumulibacter manganitolerans]